MKNYFVLALMILSMVSCSSELNENSIEEKQLEVCENSKTIELLNVKNQIETLNQTMFTPKTNTRGIGKWFKKIFAVVTADAVGGLFGLQIGGPCGAAAGAIMASGLAAAVPENHITLLTLLDQFLLTRADTVIMPTSGLLPTNPVDIALRNVVPSGNWTKSDSIGYYHNLAIIEIKSELNDTPVSYDVMLDKVAEKTSVLYDVNAIQIKNDINLNKGFFDHAGSSELSAKRMFTFNNLIQAWSALYPDKAEELEVLETFFDGLSNIEVEDNEGEYLDSVLKIINESSLDDNTKQNLRNSFIVGNASYQLWDI